MEFIFGTDTVLLYIYIMIKKQNNHNFFFFFLTKCPLQYKENNLAGHENETSNSKLQITVQHSS